MPFPRSWLASRSEHKLSDLCFNAKTRGTILLFENGYLQQFGDQASLGPEDLFERSTICTMFDYTAKYRFFTSSSFSNSLMLPWYLMWPLSTM